MMDPFSLHYSDDNKKNTFNNGGNNGHGLKIVACKQTFRLLQCLSTNSLKQVYVTNITALGIPVRFVSNII